MDTINKSLVRCNEGDDEDSECVPCIMKHIISNYDTEEEPSNSPQRTQTSINQCDACDEESQCLPCIMKHVKS